MSGQCIAVVSGKGGTGKTSFTAGVGAALAQSGRRVLCLDCDVGLRNLDISLGLSDNGALSFLDVMNGSYQLSDATIHPGYPHLRFLTAPMNMPVEDIDLPGFSAMVTQAKGLFDYVFLDAPAGVDAGFRLVSARADRFLLVTGPGPGAIRDACRVGELLELSGKNNIRLIVNRVDKGMLKAQHLTIDDVMDSAGLPLLGVVPEDDHVTLAASFGRGLAAHAPRCPSARAFKRISNRLQGIPEPIKL